MVRGDGLPAGKTGDNHFITAAISAIRVARDVTDNDGQIRFGHQAVALDGIAHLIGAEITQIRGFDIMADQAIRPELINDFLAQIPVPFFECVFTMKPHTAQQGNIFQPGAAFKKFFND